MPLSETLRKIEEELLKKDDIRQEIQSSMRKATRLSKRAIFLVHKNQLDEAEKTLREAEGLFDKLDGLSKGFPDLLYVGSVDSAFQEYTEALVFVALVREGRFPGLDEIHVPPVSYVLGLADVIGELRRRVLDALRNGETERAEDCLDFMETIHAELTNLDNIQILVRELRRKCDTGRRVIEATRGDITIDARRNLLENSIRKLTKTLEAEKEE